MDSNVVLIIVTCILGLVLPFVQEPLNNLWKVNGGKALALAGVLSAVLAVVALFLTGQLTVEMLNVQNLSPVILLVFSVGTVVFQSVKDRLGWAGK